MVSKYSAGLSWRKCIMEENIMEVIMYKQWETTDCTTVHTYAKE